jgi:hypothetical protein
MGFQYVGNRSSTDGMAAIFKCALDASVATALSLCHSADQIDHVVGLSRPPSSTFIKMCKLQCNELATLGQQRIGCDEATDLTEHFTTRTLGFLGQLPMLRIGKP